MKIDLVKETVAPPGAPAAVSFDAKPQANFMESNSGLGERRLAWQNSGVGSGSFFDGFSGLWGLNHNGRTARDSSLASRVAHHEVMSNSITHTIVLNAIVTGVGTGLTLASRPRARALGISPEVARELSDRIESLWQEYAGSPLEVDASGRQDLHSLAAAAYRSYLLSGEVLVPLGDALASGLHCVSKSTLANERDAEIEGVGRFASEAAQKGLCLDYAYAGPRRPVRKPKAATVDKPQSSAPTPSPEPEQPLSPFAAAVLDLEEAKARPSAARTLLRMHRDDSTLSISEAAALLAALPIEHHNIEAPTMSYSFTSHADAATEQVIVRSVEIRALGLSQKGARGDDAAKAEARRLNAALASYRNGEPIGKALHSAGADVAAVSDAAKRALGAAV